MSDPSETGNPVFDYRADFRRFALAIQRGLSAGGLGLSAAWSLYFVTSGGAQWKMTLTGLGIGLGACLAGIAWGFFWRNRLRADFRRQFGPQ